MYSSKTLRHNTTYVWHQAGCWVTLLPLMTASCVCVRKALLCFTLLMHTGLLPDSIPTCSSRSWEAGQVASCSSSRVSAYRPPAATYALTGFPHTSRRRAAKSPAQQRDTHAFAVVGRARVMVRVGTGLPGSHARQMQAAVMGTCNTR
jgi:hypothetical protein